MRIIAISDIHGSLRYLNDIIPHLTNSDLAVIAGDITNFGDRDEAERIIAPIKDYSKRLIAVYGNCDYPAVEKYIEEIGVSVAWRWRKIENYTFVGLGGSLTCPARTPGEYSDEKYSDFLESLTAEAALINDDIVLVTHEPPRGTKCDLAMGGLHVGSQSIRKFIEEKQPILVITGHIHEAKSVDRIGESVVVNPGPFRRGNYAVIEISDSGVEVVLKP